jgi:hypothetical protein
VHQNFGRIRGSLRVFSAFLESRKDPKLLFYRASYRKTGFHFSGRTLGRKAHAGQDYQQLIAVQNTIAQLKAN